VKLRRTHAYALPSSPGEAKQGFVCLPAVLNPKTPVARPAPTMRYRDDTDDISLEAEDQAVRKSLELDSAVNAIKPFTQGGRFKKQGNYSLDFSSNVASQPALPHLIVLAASMRSSAAPRKNAIFIA
jgi:hypothetical protein